MTKLLLHTDLTRIISQGGNLKAMISELHGRVTGCAKGLGGSMHLIDMKAGVTAVPIVGSTLPIGVGKAWGNKLSKKKRYRSYIFWRRCN